MSNVNETFEVKLHSNPYVPPGTKEIVVVFDVQNLSDAASAPSAERGILMVLDNSVSMAGARTHGLHVALKGEKDTEGNDQPGAIDVLDPSINLAMVRFSAHADLIFPPPPKRSDKGEPRPITYFLPATVENKQRAKTKVALLDGSAYGTDMGGALVEVEEVINAAPEMLWQILFLTDGENNGDEAFLKKAVERLTGRTRVDVRIIGAEANVPWMRDNIATPLGGQVAVIKDPKEMGADFSGLFAGAMNVALGGVKLVFSCFKTCEVVSVTALDPKLELKVVRQGTDFMVDTTAWSPQEKRIIMVRFRLVPIPGRESLFPQMISAGRSFNLAQPKVVWTEGGQTHEVRSDMVTMEFTDDTDRTLVLDKVVSRATGQLELVEERQNLAAALRKGDKTAATVAVNSILDHAKATGNPDDLEAATVVLNNIGVRVGSENSTGMRTVYFERLNQLNLADFDAKSTVTSVSPIVPKK